MRTWSIGLLAACWMMAACASPDAATKTALTDAQVDGDGLATVSGDIDASTQDDAAVADGDPPQDASTAALDADGGPSPADAQADVHANDGDDDSDDDGDNDDGDTEDAGPACPTAIVSVIEGALVVPQTVLHLIGDKSQTIGGTTVKKYTWSVTTPPSSTQSLVPSSSFPNPTFTTDVIGDYEFCLTVWDSKDQQSCVPACTKVTVAAASNLQIELSWKTPASCAPPGAPDFDLHVANELAASLDLDCDGSPDPWFSVPYDCFWFDKSCKWAPPGSTTGNPTLTPSGAYGTVESLSLDQTAGTVASPKSYSVGVHYWHDHGCGPATPTVQIYMLGVLVFSATGPAMTARDFWYVGKIHWPNSLASQGSQQAPMTLCYQQGQPCSTTAPGKMWTASGSWCIRPCYGGGSFFWTKPGGPTSTCVFP